MPEGDDAAHQGKHEAIAANPSVLAPEPKTKNNRQREHEGALEPAKIAGRLSQNFADEEHDQRCSQGNDPGQCKRPLT